MKKVTLAVLSLALLSACGQRAAAPDTAGTPAVAGQEAAQQAAGDAADEAKQARADAALAEASAKRMAQYKRALLPLVVGSYAGECSSQAEGAKSRAAISVAADGTVSAPGMKARSIMEADAIFTVSKEAPSKAMRFVAGGDTDPWHVSMQKTPEPTTMFASGAAGIQCANQSGAVPGADIYPLAARFFVAAARSMKCTDGTSIPKTFKIVPAATSVTIGETTYALVRADGTETLTVGTDEKALTYQMGVVDGESITIQLDQAGALSVFSALGGPSKKMFSCFADQQ
jgi:hypothetical protein